MLRNKIMNIGLTIIIGTGIFKFNVNEIEKLNNYELLKKCEIYKDTSLSKNDFYKNLIENLGYNKKDAEYIVNNLGVDYQANANECAKMYEDAYNLSKKGTYEAVIKYGDFTKEEAKRAVDNLSVNFEMNAIVKLLNYEKEFNLNEEEMYKILKEEMFEEEDIENAIKTIKYFRG